MFTVSWSVTGPWGTASFTTTMDTWSGVYTAYDSVTWWGREYHVRPL